MPCVEAPTQVLTGVVANPVSRIHLLFGATKPIPDEALAARYGSSEGYLKAYEQAADAAIEAGFAVPEDRAELLDGANPDLIPAEPSPLFVERAARPARRTLGVS